uniref:Retrotransposon gag domain-containing protein n=1 Tax=Chromera velia CCMP2878 TaxID=1169474 RepID=A0A0G4IFE4_9ALVE|eukprot:Cvel_13951.t1-p1 / transcript=Cvel_13951.t1 / gene=Cvel_13951 / organism=Chromera_velia_CCMP2878 / gene_product=hypothetical protein / transcript_product=hypothetical protein / location=Cvel_scaffold974:25945-26700(+) / protein_length=252 / sequence_SO=supercontig / SO=protein_coding / is_pseudo=false
MEGFTREFEELKALYQAQAAEIAELRAILGHLHSTSSSAFAKTIKPIYDYAETVEEFEDWVRVCEKYRNFHGMTDAQLLSAADSHLKGDAVKAVKLAKKNGHTPVTWLELQTVLLTYFQDRRTRDDHRDELDRMKCVGVLGTDLKTYTSNFISKMLFIPDMSMSDKVYQYEKGLSEDVQKEVKRKKPANLEAAVRAAFEALSIVPHPSVSFAAAATHPRTLPSTEVPPVTVGGGHMTHDPTGLAPMDIGALG